MRAPCDNVSPLINRVKRGIEPVVIDLRLTIEKFPRHALAAQPHVVADLTDRPLLPRREAGRGIELVMDMTIMSRTYRHDLSPLAKSAALVWDCMPGRHERTCCADANSFSSRTWNGRNAYLEPVPEDAQFACR